MPLAPVLTKLIAHYVSPLLVATGSGPAMAATSLTSVDLGGYQIAKALAPTTESWLLTVQAATQAAVDSRQVWTILNA